MGQLSSAGVIAVAGTAVLVIACWVLWQYGKTAAVVVLACSAGALSTVWIRFELLPIESWRQGYLTRTLAIFSVPAVVAVVASEVIRRRRARRNESDNAVTAFDRW
ncbi:MAG: hypothetical protein WCP28_22595, partial [Actinomycetes bacterium]